MIDLSYKSYTNKDYMVDEVFKLINANNFVHKVNRNELRKLTTNTLLILLSKLQEKKLITIQIMIVIIVKIVIALMENV